MKERPDELAADIFKSEFEMRVLIDSVMATEISRSADRHSLLIGDFFGADQARGIASSGRSNGRIVRMREMIPQRDARRGSFHLRFRAMRRAMERVAWP